MFSGRVVPKTTNAYQAMNACFRGRWIDFSRLDPNFPWVGGDGSPYVNTQTGEVRPAGAAATTMGLEFLATFV